MKRTISEKGLELIKQWEGFSNTVYKDVAGLPTIGVGHLLTQYELSSGKIDIYGNSIKYRYGLTNEQVLDLLHWDINDFVDDINDLVMVELNQNQFDALVSFAFNVGTKAFYQSTLLKKLNQHLYDEVPGQLMRWVYSGGRKINGLVNRRNNEIKLWNGEI